MNKEKAKKITIYILRAAFLACIVFFIVRCLYNNRVVATEEGNRIYYNQEIYEETFEVFEIKIDKCLGRVESSPQELKYKLYSLEEKPGYIYVKMFLDERIYKRIAN